MENQNQTSTDLSNVKKMFSGYQKQKEQSSGKKKTKEEILAKYFVPRNSVETFRILPPKAGRKHIEEAYFHVVVTNASGGVLKHGSIIYCPAHNDPRVQKLDAQGQPVVDANNQPVLIPAPCPLCAKHKKLINRQDPSIKYIKKENLTDPQKKIKENNDAIYKEAVKWEAKKFYIIRGIDKGAAKDGVKFWRFKHNFKNQGTLDKLLPILEMYVTDNQVDFADPNNGTDLSIIMTDSEFTTAGGVKRTYKAISAITSRGKSPLHSDPIIAREWLNDTITWRDVFKAKTAPCITPYEYLEMVADGKSPYFDQSDEKNKRWVFPGRPDLEQAANTRNRDLDGSDDESFEYASDIDDEQGYVTINNITPSNVGSYADNAVDIADTVINENQSQPSGENKKEETYDDLPF